MENLAYLFDDEELGPTPCNNGTTGNDVDDARTSTLRRYSYGVVLPIVCCFGILGNVFNLIVLTRRNMKGTAYIYMRGYSAAALMAIVFAIPFGLRILTHRETGAWTNLPQAFYHAHLELFLGNGCLGVGVMMLLALTVERYVSVCHPGQPRPMMGQPRLIVTLILLLTFIVYLPGVFRTRLSRCVLPSTGLLVYHKNDNLAFLHSIYYSIYKVVLEVVFKVGPTVLLAGLNLRIMIVYRHSCDRRRRMTSRPTTDDDPRKFAEERRLILLLGSTSILFLVCVSPMVILNVTLSQDNLSIFSYQVFRAIANLLEVTNYSITFYIYCLFSEDFRNTLLRTIRWPWSRATPASAYPPSTPLARKLIAPRQSTPPTGTTSTTNPSSLSSASSKMLWLGCPCWYLQAPARESV